MISRPLDTVEVTLVHQTSSRPKMLDEETTQWAFLAAC
jgi:hypothetical protein